MAAEGNEEVAVPTNQPLLSMDADNDDLESECVNEKEITKENIAEASKPSAEAKSVNGGGVQSKGKVAVGASMSAGGGGGRSSRTGHGESTMAKSQSEIQVCVNNSLSVSQTSKNSLMTFSSSGTFYDHATTSKKKVDLRITPKRVNQANGKDITDFRQMEQGLLQLLEDFHSGKLEAFGQDCTFEKMENVREQQERLARLHFDLNAQQELCGQHTEEGTKMAKTNLSKLMENLQQLSLSIEKLQAGSLGIQTDM